jgi:hypothetical protein
MSKLTTSQRADVFCFFFSKKKAVLAFLPSDRRSIAALEFALIAPILATMTVGIFDLARAFIIWEQINDAAEAIAEAAEKLSVTTDAQGQPAAMLTAAQMQAAMSTVYAEIPGLQWGTGTGMFPGQFSVTLSGVVFRQANQQMCSTNTGCTEQRPYTLWSSFFTEQPQGGTQLITSPASQLLRSCNGPLTAVAQFPDRPGTNQLLYMVRPSMPGVTVPLVPQVVADVRYDYTPNFPFFLGSGAITLWASATLPAPIGGVTQAITFNNAAPAGNVVQCN